MFGSQFPNNTLGQSSVNKNALKQFQHPDTDSRLIKVVNGATSVAPNLMHDHTRFEYISPTGNVSTVNFNNPINTEDRGLHYLTLDNSNNTGAKTFVFSPAYVFLDDPSNLTNTYIVQASKKLIWYGTFTDGKLQLRLSSESTN